MRYRSCKIVAKTWQCLLPRYVLGVLVSAFASSGVCGPAERGEKPMSNAVLLISRKPNGDSLNKFYSMWNWK